MRDKTVRVVRLVVRAKEPDHELHLSNEDLIKDAVTDLLKEYGYEPEQAWFELDHFIVTPGPARKSAPSTNPSSDEREEA